MLCPQKRMIEQVLAKLRKDRLSPCGVTRVAGMPSGGSSSPASVGSAGGRAAGCGEAASMLSSHSLQSQVSIMLDTRDLTAASFATIASRTFFCVCVAERVFMARCRKGNGHA